MLDNIAPGLEKSSKTEWVINQIDNAIVGIHENYKAIITALRRDIENMAAASLRPQAALPGEAVRAEKLLHQITNLLWSAAPIRLDDKQAAIDLITAALRAPSADMMCVERGVCEEIKQIMQTYREQEAERGYVDTPGGLEHMGDVWRLLSEWDDKLRAAARGDAAQIDENATDDRDADLPTAEDVRGILAPGDAAQKAEPEWIDKFTDEIT